MKGIILELDFHVSPLCFLPLSCLWSCLHQSFRDSSALNWSQKLTLSARSHSLGGGRCRHVGVGQLGRRDVYPPPPLTCPPSLATHAHILNWVAQVTALCTTCTFKLWCAIKTPTFRSGGVGRSSSDACFACCLARSRGHETEIEPRAGK